MRAYVDLLADAAGGISEAPAAGQRGRLAQRRDRPDHAARPARRLDPRLGARRGPRRPWPGRRSTSAGAVGETIDLLRPLLRNHRAPLGARRRAARRRSATRPRFRQVLELLLENEAKYAPRGWGVSVGAWRQVGEIRVYVTDDGPGIPIEEWETVFEAFVRKARQRGRGSGIGLYAARRLMDAMGGRVWIEGNGYGGSRFVVALPAAGER